MGSGPRVRSFWRALTFGGYAELWGLIYAALLFWPGGGGRMLGIELATTELVGLCVLIPLRYLVRRERPTAKKPGPIPIPWERYSFPSSHALRSAGVAVVMGLHFSGMGWAALPVALLVGWSRVPLGRHYPSDVVAGCVLGTVCGGMGVWLAGILF